MAAYSQAALDSFLRLAQNYQDGAIWQRSDLCAVSEVDGVCAWEEATAALEYARLGSYPVAVFDGVKTGLLPERGGVCARVNATIELLDVVAFEAKYCRMPAIIEPEAPACNGTAAVTGKSAEALAALNRIANRGGIAGTEDAVTWQQEQRADRTLPGRDA